MQKQSNKRKKKRFLCSLLSLIIGISMIPAGSIPARAAEDQAVAGNQAVAEDQPAAEQEAGAEEQAQAAQVGTRESYVYEGYRVEYEITSGWEGAYNASLTITNTGNHVIEDWMVSFSCQDDISDVYNGSILSHREDVWVIENAGWNQDIPVGGRVNLGFCVSYEGELLFPAGFTMIQKELDTREEGYRVEYSLESDWGSGFTASMRIYNLSDTVIKDWQAEFDYNREITSLWDAQLVSHEGSRYVVKNGGWNQNIDPGAFVSFGFTGTGGSSGEEPYQITLTNTVTDTTQPVVPEYDTTFTSSKEFEELNGGTFPAMYSDDGGRTIYFLDGTYTSGKVKSMEDAIASIAKVAPVLNFHEETDSFQGSRTEETDTRKVFRLQQMYRGIPVYGREVIIEADGTGKTLSLTSTFEDGLTLDTTPSITEGQAKELACAPHQGMEAREIRLMVYGNQKDFRLVYQVQVLDPATQCGHDALIDAGTGDILEEIGREKYASSVTLTGEGVDGKELTVNGTKYNALESILHGGMSYALHDQTRNIKVYDCQSGTGLPSQPVLSNSTKIDSPAGLSAMDNFGKAYDFYLNRLGWKSYNGKGAAINVYVNLGDKNKPDKEWEDAEYRPGFFNPHFVIGDFKNGIITAGLDTAVHEYTHGVLSEKWGTDYSRISDAIEEAYGDIMGCMAQALAGGKGEVWLAGEYLRAPRNLANPEKSKCPTQYKGEFWIDEGTDDRNKFVHQNSTVVSNVAYKIGGMVGGYENMAKLWFGSIKYLPHSNQDFSGVRRAIYLAGREMGYSEPVQLRIQDAFYQNNIDFVESGSITLTSEQYKSAVLNYFHGQFVPVLSYGGHSYAVYKMDEVSGFREAEVKCNQMGGHLVTISSKEENQAICNHLKGQGYVSAYLGLTDQEKEGVWKWVTGEEVIYTNWAKGEPNNSMGNEDYAMFYYKYADGTWNDGSFLSGNTMSDVNIFICEWED